MPESEELELLLMPDGTTIVNLCSACLLGEKDDRCKPASSSFVQELIREGHVTDVRDAEGVTP